MAKSARKVLWLHVNYSSGMRFSGTRISVIIMATNCLTRGRCRRKNIDDSGAKGRQKFGVTNGKVLWLHVIIHKIVDRMLHVPSLRAIYMMQLSLQRGTVFAFYSKNSSFWRIHTYCLVMRLNPRDFSSMR